MVVVQFVWLNGGLVGDRGGVGVVPPLGMFCSEEFAEPVFGDRGLVRPGCNWAANCCRKPTDVMLPDLLCFLGGVAGDRLG